MIETLNLNKQKMKQEICEEHNITLLYYCNTCNESLCSDCYMFGNKHKDHQINKLENIYLSHVELIKNESKEIKNKFDKLNNYLKLLNEKIIFVRNYKTERSMELDDVFDNMRNKLETLMHEKLTKLINSKNMIIDKLKYLDNIKVTIENELNDAPKTELISKSENMIKNLKNLDKEDEINTDILNISLDLPSDIHPPYESAYFLVKEYKKIISQNSNTGSNDVLYSDELKTNGLVWRLKVYPNGNGTIKGEYISVFLELREGLLENSKYFYKIELENIHSRNFEGQGNNSNNNLINLKTNFWKEFSSDFQNGECWGYNKFYRIENLEKDGFIDEGGKLVFKFYVRPQTYAQLCRDQKNYIRQIEKQNYILSNQQNNTKNINYLNENNNNLLRSSDEIVMNSFNLINNLNTTYKNQDFISDNKETIKKIENLQNEEEIKNKNEINKNINPIIYNKENNNSEEKVSSLDHQNPIEFIKNSDNLNLEKKNSENLNNLDDNNLNNFSTENHDNNINKVPYEIELNEINEFYQTQENNDNDINKKKDFKNNSKNKINSDQENLNFKNKNSYNEINNKNILNNIYDNSKLSSIDIQSSRNNSNNNINENNNLNSNGYNFNYFSSKNIRNVNEKTTTNNKNKININNLILTNKINENNLNFNYKIGNTSNILNGKNMKNILKNKESFENQSNELDLNNKLSQPQSNRRENNLEISTDLKELVMGDIISTSIVNNNSQNKKLDEKVENNLNPWISIGKSENADIENDPIIITEINYKDLINKKVKNKLLKCEKLLNEIKIKDDPNIINTKNKNRSENDFIYNPFEKHQSSNIIRDISPNISQDNNFNLGSNRNNILENNESISSEGNFYF